MGNIAGPKANLVVIACNASLTALDILYLLFSYLSTEYHFLHVPLCPFYLLTSIHCPFCGMTRAFGALLHFNLADALKYNYLAIPLLLLWLYFTVTAIFYLAKDIKKWQKI